MNKQIITFSLLLLLFLWARATHMQPYQSQLEVGSAIANKHIEVVKERIDIHIDSTFSNAHYEVTYTFSVKTDGVSMPFLFYQPTELIAYDSEVSAVLDGVPIRAKNYLPNDISNPYFLFPETTEDNDFLLSFGNFGADTPYVGYYPMRKLMYIDTLLEEGMHTLKMEYDQSVWMDATNTLKKRSFRYSLSAAKAWTSFEEIEVHLTTDNNQTYTINQLDNNKETTGDADITLKEISEDFIVITSVPKLNFIQKGLLYVFPNGIWIFIALSVFFFWLGWKWTARFRAIHPENKYNRAAIISGMFVPTFSVGLFGLLGVWLEKLAGPDIKSDGSFFSAMLFLFMYLWWIIIPICMLILISVDKGFKKKIRQ